MERHFHFLELIRIRPSSIEVELTIFTILKLPLNFL